MKLIEVCGPGGQKKKKEGHKLTPATLGLPAVM
jgi:hypothetical protein